MQTDDKEQKKSSPEQVYGNVGVNDFRRGIESRANGVGQTRDLCSMSRMHRHKPIMSNSSAVNLLTLRHSLMSEQKRLLEQTAEAAIELSARDLTRVANLSAAIKAVDAHTFGDRRSNEPGTIADHLNLSVTWPFGLPTTRLGPKIQHQYKVGETVFIAEGVRVRDLVAGGKLTILRLLSADDLAAQYRVVDLRTGKERVVEERLLGGRSRTSG